jgi:hypothetical protein
MWTAPNNKHNAFIQGDQKVSVHMMITVKSSGAQRLFDHPVVQSWKA